MFPECGLRVWDCWDDDDDDGVCGYPQKAGQGSGRVRKWALG